MRSSKIVANLRTETNAGGDGPKMIDLLQMREKNMLQDRIEILGPVRHNDVRDVSVYISRYS